VLETIVMTMPFENHERTFEIFVSWSRYGDLFAYDENTRTISRQ
jgi:hypothetical protein